MTLRELIPGAAVLSVLVACATEGEQGATGGEVTPASDAGQASVGHDGAAGDGSAHAESGTPPVGGDSGACLAGEARCGAACVSFKSDPKNCGACGHDCGAHPCLAATCQTYEVLATNQGGARGLAVDATYVYWTSQSDNTVMKMPLTGGTAVPLASGQNSPYALAVDAQYAYWTNDGDGTVKRVAIGGGSSEPLGTGGGQGIALDGTAVYWVGGGQLTKWMKSGGAATKIADAPGATQVVVQGPWVYLAGAPVGSPVVSRVSTSGGNPTQVSTSKGSFVLGLAVDATSVYWADGQDVLKAPLAGGAAFTLASSFGVWQIATDATSIYWADGMGLMKTPLAGGPAKTLATCPSDMAVRLAVDGTTLYWTSTNSGQVLKVAK